MMNRLAKFGCPRIPPSRGTESSLYEVDGPITDYDDSDILSDFSESAAHDQAVRTIPQQHVPSHLLMVSLLEHVCSIYEPDPKMKDDLFKAICKHLANLKVMSPLCYVDELEMIRDHYKQVFSVMLDTARRSIYESNSRRMTTLSLPSQRERLAIMFQPHVNHKEPCLKMSDVFDMNTTRYTQEFLELKCLGKGGFGSVFKARHKLDGCLYAIKKISLAKRNPEVWLKILREVRVLANLSHPHVVGYNAAWLQHERVTPVKLYPVDTHVNKENVDDSDIVFQHSDGQQQAEKSTSSLCVGEKSHNKCKNGTLSVHSSHDNSSNHHSTDSTWLTGDLLHNSKAVLYIQMQLCTSTLKDWIHCRNLQCNGRQDVFECVDELRTMKVLKQILLGVDYIHSQGLIHRDIKPRNIFLQGDFTVKIGDFGLARDDLTGDVRTPVTPLVDFQFEDFFTVEDHTSGVGTSIYGAPEQLNGSSYDNKCDMFSVGVTMFEMYHPFTTEMERVQTLHKLHSGYISDEFKDKWPQQTTAVLTLISADPTLRPSAKTVLDSEIFLTKDEIITKLNSKLEAQAKEIANLKKYIQQLESRKC